MWQPRACIPVHSPRSNGGCTINLPDGGSKPDFTLDEGGEAILHRFATQSDSRRRTHLGIYRVRASVDTVAGHRRSPGGCAPIRVLSDANATRMIDRKPSTASDSSCVTKIVLIAGGTLFSTVYEALWRRQAMRARPTRSRKGTRRGSARAITVPRSDAPQRHQTGLAFERPPCLRARKTHRASPSHAAGFWPLKRIWGVPRSRKHTAPGPEYLPVPARTAPAWLPPRPEHQFGHSMAPGVPGIQEAIVGGCLLVILNYSCGLLRHTTASRRWRSEAPNARPHCALAESENAEGHHVSDPGGCTRMHISLPCSPGPVSHFTFVAFHSSVLPFAVSFFPSFLLLLLSLLGTSFLRLC